MRRPVFSFFLFVFASLLAASPGVPGAAGAQPSPPAPTQDTTRLTFEEALRIAMNQNTDIKRAEGSARQAGTRVQAERMDFAPSLSVGSRFSRSFGRTFSQEQIGFITESTDYMSLNGGASVTLFNGFENFASLQEAQAQNKARKKDLGRARRDVAFEVIKEFFKLAETKEILRVRREELKARQEQLRQIERFVETGARPVSDQYQEEARVAEAEQAILQAERDLELSRTRLINTLHLDPRRPYRFEVPDLKSEALAPKNYQLPPLLKEAYRNRLDLQVAKAEREAAEQGVRGARSSYYPSISVSAGYGTRWTSRPRPLPDPNTGKRVEPGFARQLDNNRSGSVSLSVSVPIFEGLRRNLELERAEVQAQEARYALEDQRNQVALEVRQAYLDYRNAKKQLEATEKRLQATRQAREQVRKQYNLGSASIVDLQSATRNYVEAASQQVQARYNLLLQQKKIDYHTGRLDPRQVNLMP